MDRDKMVRLIKGHGLIRSLWHCYISDSLERHLKVEFVDGYIEIIPLLADGSDVNKKADFVIAASSLPRSVTDKIRNRDLNSDFLLYKNPHLVEIDDDFSMPL